VEIASGVLSVLGRSIDTVQRVFQRRCELLSTGRKTWYNRCFKAGDDMSLGETNAAKSERERERERERENLLALPCFFWKLSTPVQGQVSPWLGLSSDSTFEARLETCFRLYSNCCEKFLRPARCLGFRV